MEGRAADGRDATPPPSSREVAVAGAGGFLYGLKAGLKGAVVVALGAVAALVTRRSLGRR